MKTYTRKKTSVSPELKTDYEKELNREQLEVVLNGDGP
jgi:hypothetical protein